MEMPYEHSPRQLYIVDVITGERKGPYPSGSYISKNILIGGAVKCFKPGRKKPYKGRYFFEDVDKSS